MSVPLHPTPSRHFGKKRKEIGFQGFIHLFLLVGHLLEHIHTDERSVAPPSLFPLSSKSYF